MLDELLGKVVYSKSGRDKGRMFVIIAVVDNKQVIIADGELRKVESGKTKNIKHIQPTKIRSEEVIASLRQGEKLENQIIRKSLKRIRESGAINGKEVW